MSIIKTSTCHFLTKSQEIKLLTFLAINLIKKSGTNNNNGVKGARNQGNYGNREPKERMEPREPSKQWKQWEPWEPGNQATNKIKNQGPKKHEFKKLQATKEQGTGEAQKLLFAPWAIFAPSPGLKHADILYYVYYMPLCTVDCSPNSRTIYYNASLCIVLYYSLKSRVVSWRLSLVFRSLYSPFIIF